LQLFVEIASGIGHVSLGLAKPVTVHIDILGNADAFVHAHIWPRHGWEASELVWRPVWLYDLSNWRNPATALGEQHSPLRTRITKELRS